MTMQHPPQESLLQEALELIRRSINGIPYKNQKELARACGESEANISRWLSGAAAPTLRRLEPVLTCLGIGFTIRRNTHVRITQSELFSEENLLQNLNSWSSLADGTAKQRFLRLRMPGNDTSMQPAIFPGDIVLVDTLDKSPEDGKIYLIEQQEGEDRNYVFRRAFIQNREAGCTVVLCPETITKNCRPLMTEAPLLTGIIGSVRHSIRSFF
ncbi:MAG: helix-turn-helix domain-containing protein [Desulfovibrio sp.]|nr:helix-turn-helix domain-containing protein [Desulfovibrio sp.]